MNKLFLVALVGSVSLLLTGCGTDQTSQLMPAVTYNQPVDFKSSKAALLYWDYGKIISAQTDEKNIFDYTPAGMLVHSVTQAHKDQYDQDDVLINYGKAQQVVFLTSLRDVLTQSAVFKSVTIITAPQKPAADQLLIELNFQKSVVLKGEHGYPIELDVVMTVSDAKGQVVTQEFDIKPKNTVGSYIFDNFKDAQIYASQQLMKDVITAINELPTSFS